MLPKAGATGLQYVQEKANGLQVHALVDSGATHNFVSIDEAKRLGINITKEGGSIKTVNSNAKPICGVARNLKAEIGEWVNMIDLSWYQWTNSSSCLH